MKYFSGIIYIIVFSFTFSSCKPRREAPEAPEVNPALNIYRASVTQVNDLVHTRLEVEPDIEKKELAGIASLTVKPHFFPVDSLVLDAKYMRIKSVRKVSWKQNPGEAQFDTVDLKYSYDSLRLRIGLDKRYTREEYYTVIINYVAQPEKVKSKGSNAISDAKGMYFINTDQKVPGKPVQIWTQGETEAASCWFPTIDAPNQKTSEEVLVTVPQKYRTLSNGKLLGSKELRAGKRQDHWKQDLPHAPYLFALVIGEFAEVKDRWNGKDVNYYVEPAFEPYARMVFGNTPEMLEFYSNILQVPYPWDKFHQVVVRDFVSGAMENTGCVVHYDKLQHNRREHLDNTCEDIVAHELFHQWFGDLVTCESWSNIPLNESFATYGEYLWNEHKYGRNEADVKLAEFQSSYFTESEYKSEDLIRYHYVDKEEMFDAHSYQKGGSILHMLRKYVGDDAFFASLKLYLNRMAFRTAEVSDLRKAFEEVTGEDLNWFFNQWFLDKGHPDLKVFHQTYNGSGEIYGLTVVQQGKQYKLPVDVDVYTAGGVERHRLVIEKDSQTFGIHSKNKPLCVIFDAENQLLADIEETKTIEGWESQFRLGPLAEQKILAFHQLLNLQASIDRKVQYCQVMLADSFWRSRQVAVRELHMLGLAKAEVEPLMARVISMADHDPKSDVRKETVDIFRGMADEGQLKKMLNDSSYEVSKRALIGLMGMNRSAAFDFADLQRNENSNGFQETVFIVIGRSSPKDELDFFMEKVERGNRQTARNSASGLSYYITYNKPEQAAKVISRLVELADRKSDPGVSGNAVTALNTLRNFYYYQLYYYNMFLKDKHKKDKKQYKEKMERTQDLFNQLDAIVLKYN
jgi:aminopeptidase N